MGHCPTFLVGSEMGTTFVRSDSDKWGQGLKWGQSESRDNLLFLRKIRCKSNISTKEFMICDRIPPNFKIFDYKLPSGF